MGKVMRVAMLMGVTSGALLAPSRLTAARPMAVRCCLPFDLPGAEREPACVPVLVRPRRHRRTTRRLCRLAGGRPLKPGNACTCR